MGDVVRVEPLQDSYVTEWRAAQVDRSSMGEISKVLRRIGASVFADLADESGSIVIAVRQGINLHAAPGDWIVISPHDKIRVIPLDEFSDNFIEVI